MTPHGDAPTGAGAFDASRAVEFDVARGAVQTSGDRVVLLPAAAFDAALRDLEPTRVGALARAVGAACGARVAARLGGVERVRGAEVEVALAHLAGELAVAGIGVVRLERWGRALVVAIANPAVSDGAALAAIVEGALSAASGRAASCAVIAREEGLARVLVGSASAIERAVAWLAEGVPWSDVLARLQGRGSA
jgi:hypothetical protein